MAKVALTCELAAAGLADAARVDSAGTGDWHIGHQMDAHARAELGRRGYDGSAHRARQVKPSWLANRDLILAMDRHNLADLRRMAARAGIGGNRIMLFGAAVFPARARPRGTASTSPIPTAAIPATSAPSWTSSRPPSPPAYRRAARRTAGRAPA